MTDVVMIAGVTAGSFYDPFFWGCLVAAGLVALLPRAGWFGLAVLVVLAILARVLISEHNRTALGLGSSPVLVHMAIGTALSMLIVFSVVRLATRSRRANES